jgi:PmbA protein
MEIEQIYKKVEREVDQAAVKLLRSIVTQVRFSNNMIDITNQWNEETASVFVAKKGKTFMFNVRNEDDLEKIMPRSLEAMQNIEKNDDFLSLNDKKNVYRQKKFKDQKFREIDGQEFVNDFIDRIKPFVKRSGGVFYKKEVQEEVQTPFNGGSQKRFGVEFVARAFNNDNYPVQTSFTSSSDDDFPLLFKQDEEILDLSRKIRNIKDGRDGKFSVIFSPLCFASLVSYTIPMASAFQIDSGMSMFADRMEKKVGNSYLTMYDDPLDDSMFESRTFDDEGTPVRKTAVIEKGIVKNFLHNYSTAKKYNVDTTGNAGIISPTPWQISVEPGNEDFDDMIASTKRGLYIVNTWYTRFQDYREGVFSTIPRDGIFFIENGEIKESWSGIRISDSLLKIFKNIEGISRETKKVKWWDETLHTKSPYVSVYDVNISKSR